jgi:spermidine synthase
LSKNEKFDIVVDDGPHTIDSMVTFIKLYSQLLKEDGILVVEDVQSMDWIKTLHDATPDALKPYIEVYDRRTVKGRYDDILFVINLTKRSD